MGADKLGSLVHEILEEIYRELAEVNPNIEILAIQSIFPSIEDRVDAKFNLDKYANYLITGQNYIVKQVTTKYLQEFLKQQIAEIADNRVPFQILTLENKDATEELASFSPTISASFMLDIAGESIPLTIKGITDRIDKVDTKVRIIDYKTGKVKTDDLKISNSELNRLIEDRKADKVRQLWLYKYIVAKRVREQGEFQVGEYRIQEHEDIRAGIYSFKNLEAGFMELNTKEKESIFPETLKEYVKVSEEYLTEIVRNMLNPAQAFEKTTDLDACKYCAYKDICGR
jgi:RecB family exonuclease